MFGAVPIIKALLQTLFPNLLPGALFGSAKPSLKSSRPCAASSSADRSKTKQNLSYPDIEVGDGTKRPFGSTASVHTDELPLQQWPPENTFQNVEANIVHGEKQ